MTVKRLRREDTIIIAVDFQEKLMSAMHEADAVENSAVRLFKGLKEMDIPVIVTQQYTKGLGMTISSVAEAIGSTGYIEKSSFSTLGCEKFVETFEKAGRKTVLITGAETHICVEQTALDLLERGYTVFVAADCVASRTAQNRDLALRRMENAGAVITGYESVLYELLGGSDAPEFKAVSKIVK